VAWTHLLGPPPADTNQKAIMMRIFILGLLFSSCKLFAQSDSGALLIQKDPRLDLLIKKQVEYNELTTRDSRRNIPGYRIEVINSSDRNKVFAAKTRIYQQYPELKPYLLYQPPNYKLKIGNFKTSDEAEPYLEQLTKIFPTGVYLIHDTIEIKLDN
jgi:Uma2 family endonuclease